VITVNRKRFLYAGYHALASPVSRRQGKLYQRPMLPLRRQGHL